MNWLAVFSGLVKLVVAIADMLRDRDLIAAGEARGRAASDADHAREAAARAEEMHEIASRPPPRAEIEKRLKEGSA